MTEATLGATGADPNAAAAATPAAAVPAAAAKPNGGTDGATPAAPDSAAVAAAAAATPTTDWRQEYVTRADFKGDKDKTLAFLNRYTTQQAMIDAHLSLKQKLDSGEFKKELSADAKPEEVAEYRKSHGIPDKPEDYLAKLPDGLVIGEEDKALVGSFAEAAHAANLPPAAVHTALSWYYDVQDKAMAERADLDAKAKVETEDALRIEWGQDYRANHNRVNAFLSGAPKEVADLIQGARLPDGTPFGSHAGVIGWLAKVAREINPAGVIVGTGGDQAKTIDDELAAIDKARRTDRRAYNRDEAMQARERELINAKQQMQGRR